MQMNALRTKQGSWPYMQFPVFVREGMGNGVKGEGEGRGSARCDFKPHISETAKDNPIDMGPTKSATLYRLS